MFDYTTLLEEARSAPTLVESERDDAIVTLTLRDPSTLNCLSVGLTVQLREHLQALAVDPSVRAIVLTGADPGFSAGGDLRLMARTFDKLADPSDDEGTVTMWRWIRNEFGGIARAIARMDKAVIAAVGGPAAGVGLAFVLTSDLVLLSERALLVPAFGRLGLVPEVGTSWALTRRIGYQRAFELYVSGRHLSPAEAVDAGLANAVVAHDVLLDEAHAWAQRIVALPPHAVAMAKPLLRAAADATWDHAITMEEFAEPTCFTTAAFKSAVHALL